MKKIIKYEDLRKANKSEKCKILLSIIKGQTVYIGNKKENEI